MISPVSRSLPRNIISDFMLIVVWGPSLSPSLNGLFLPERCVLFHTVSPLHFIEVFAIQDGYSMPDFDFRVDGGS